MDFLMFITRAYEVRIYPSMLVENPTMDERLLDLKSSDSMKQELSYKDLHN